MDRKHSLPVHPRTGLVAIGFGKRGPIWPVVGGADVDLPAFLALDEAARTAHLAGLSAEEFTALGEALEAHIAELLADDNSDVAALNAAADARDAVQAETTTRDEAAAAATAEREAARARLAGETAEGETPDGEGDGAGDDTAGDDAGDGEGTGDGAGDGDAAGDGNDGDTGDGADAGEGGDGAGDGAAAPTARQPVAAAAPAPARLPAVAASARRTTPPRPRQAQRNRGSIVAAAGSATVAAGSTMTREQLVEALTDGANGMIRSGSLADGQERRSVVASLKANYSPERTLSDLEGIEVTTAKMEAIARAAEAAASTPGGLTAAGGLCAPTAVDYSIVDISDDARPLRDGLAQVQVTRGGIRFIPPRKLSDITSGIDQWTVANDLSPSAPATKSRLTLACQTPVEVLLYAVTQRIQFGNINARAFPEQIDQDLKVMAAAHARKAERLLLGSIKGLGKAVTTAKLLGATRDFLAQVDVAAAYLRDQHRMSDNTVLELPVSRHFRDAIRADLARQMATDTTGNALAVTNEEITAFLARRNIKPIWTYETAATSSGAAFPVQSSSAALVDIPDTIEWDIFPAGSFQYLDGGEIQLGVVRDSTLNNTNDYEMFGESFEAVAFRGVESLHVTSTVQPDGSSAGLVNTAGAALGSAQDL